MNISTAELLETITDAATFERLATLILRKADPRFEAIIHLGINARGQPVVAPNDGFCQVPGSDPPQFLWVQHTIQHRHSLRGKWLSEDSTTLGDLPKAAREAEALRRQFPTGHFMVILSTNQRLPTEKQQHLAQDIYTAAQAKGIEAIIWEQSQYRDFLDSHRDGQWFRKEFFGILAEYLSQPLLADLSQKSLAAYAKRQFTSPDSWVSRQIDSRMRLNTKGVSSTIQVLLGESGVGKTAAAYRFLSAHVEAGGYGLYIPEQIIEHATSLEEALRQMLQQFYPRLLTDEVDQIAAHLAPGSPFVIVVDDVNQTSNPPEMIRKLVGWRQAPYLIICPMWPRFWKIIEMATIKDMATVDVVSLSRMSFDEAIDAVQHVVAVAGRSTTALDARMIAGRLRRDPLLIGAFGALLHHDPDTHMLALAHNAVETYIEQSMHAAAYASQDRYFVSECYAALQSLATTLLQRKNLYPNWKEIEAWFQHDHKVVPVLRDLARHGKICQISPNGEFRFQHDRFLEYFAVEGFRPLFAQLVEHQDVLAEPYYAELIGQALVKYPQAEPLLRQIQQLHPLALAFSVQKIGLPTTDYHRMIIQKVQDWVRFAGSSHTTPESLRGAVANCFINTDSPAVLDIVQTDFGLEVPWLGMMARLRNGDFASGVELFTRLGIEAPQNHFVIELVEHAKRYHEEQLRAALRQAFSTVMDGNTFKGTILFAGYLGFAGCEAAIVANWQQLSNRAKYLAIATWAILRNQSAPGKCTSLDLLMEYWAEMPDKEPEERTEQQMHTAQGISQLIGNQVDEPIVQYLMEQAYHRPQLYEAIAHICGCIDMPQAIAFAVRQAARREDWDLKSSLTAWASLNNPPLSPMSVFHLQELWECADNRAAVRDVAFRVWLHNVDRNTVNVLPLIQGIAADSPLFLPALQERAALGDMTCVPTLIKQLEQYPYLYRVVPHVWNEQLKQTISAHLQSCSDTIPQDLSGGHLNEHYYLAEILAAIPEKDAEMLLLEHWEHLRYSSLFVQAAVFVGTPRILALVDTIIDDYPPDIHPFTHLEAIYGLYRRSQEQRIRIDHLNHLKPYIRYLSDSNSSSLADFCYRHGGEFITWCVTHLSQQVNDDHRSIYSPTEEDLLRRLDAYSGHLRNYTLSLFDQFRKQHDPIKFLDILRRWLQHKPTLQKVTAAAYCVELIGSRADVAMLDVALEYEWEVYYVPFVKQSALFGVCRRILQ